MKEAQGQGPALSTEGKPEMQPPGGGDKSAWPLPRTWLAHVPLRAQNKILHERVSGSCGFPPDWLAGRQDWGVLKDMPGRVSQPLGQGLRGERPRVFL